MKDILIKGIAIRRELFFWLFSFAASILINIYSIIKYNTRWIELLTQLHVVLALSILIYLILLACRGVYKVFFRSAKK